LTAELKTFIFSDRYTISRNQKAEGGRFVGLFLAVAATRPGAFRVERSTIIAASPERIFGLIDDLQAWPSWSPYEKLDPNTKHKYEGPRHGVGASCSWAGNSKVGEGKMTIIESTPYERIRIRLDFVRPFKATNQGEFTFTRGANGLNVTWAMSGEAGFACKTFTLFMNMDRMIGKEFEAGLAEMKRVAESPVPVAAAR
jgi:uncharacterized protein YndB with AHSA1/START domain